MIFEPLSALRKVQKHIWTINDALHRIENRERPRSREANDIWQFEVYGSLLNSDFEILLVYLQRLKRLIFRIRKEAFQTESCDAILQKFQQSLPDLTFLRDVQEHVDEYMVGSGKDASVNPREVMAFGVSPGSLIYLDKKVSVNEVKDVVELVIAKLLK